MGHCSRWFVEGPGVIRYFAATDGNLCAVAYGTRAGFVIELECPSMHVAEQEARRMNRAAHLRAVAAQQARALRAAAAVLGRGARAGVRYFETEQDA